MDEKKLESMKLDYLGYKTTMSPPWKLVEGAALMSLRCNKTMRSLPPTIVVDKTVESIDEVKERAKAFYEEHFMVHDVCLLEPKTYQDIVQELMNGGKDSFYDELLKITKKVSPWEIPVTLIEGANNIEGQTIKVVPVLLDVPQDTAPKVIPFAEIQVSEVPNRMTVAAYVHELAHVQIESRPGYTDDLLYKEVIPVFLEKVYAFEEGEDILEGMNKIRLCSNLWGLAEDCSMRLRDPGSCHIYHELGGLLGLKLFDSFYHERKEKERKRYLDDVQKIMDGSYKVEEMLAKRGITLNAALNRSFIEKYV